MTHQTASRQQPRLDALRQPEQLMSQGEKRSLPARITRAASKQAYYTVRFLVDRDRTLDAYRAYAYFRWVDDRLDQQESQEPERQAFIERQQALADGALRGERPRRPTAEERLLVDLILGDDDRGERSGKDDGDRDGLQSYIRNMMAVMAFDANRRGRLISGQELSQYALRLATAVTDALHYFIGHADTPPPSEARYLPAMAAHITHMLRDTLEDIETGYFNVPRELLDSYGIGPEEVESAPYRDWVKSRVRLARAYFTAGAAYLDQVKSLRCRIAGYAYMARFAGILDAIEREDYRLRSAYPEFKRIEYGLRQAGSVCARALLRGRR